MSAYSDDRVLLREVVRLAQQAGRRIMEIYGAADIAVDYKDDGSPLTEADREAHRIITAGLAALTPEVPVLSEESAPAETAARRGAKRLWLVDPLDGTKQFVRRNGEFTVNIALIENGAPVIGVVYTPVSALSHYATRTHGAFMMEGDAAPRLIRARTPHPGKIVALVSRLHSDGRQQDFLANLQSAFREVQVRQLGSSLKFCLIAQGEADVYYRTRPTLEWDTAAAQCVVEAAGGSVTTAAGEALRYNKESLANPHFIAGGVGGRWRELLPEG